MAVFEFDVNTFQATEWMEVHTSLNNKSILVQKVVAKNFRQNYKIFQWPNDK